VIIEEIFGQLVEREERDDPGGRSEVHVEREECIPVKRDNAGVGDLDIVEGAPLEPISEPASE
jgi:hypothetical protein